MKTDRGWCLVKNLLITGGALVTRRDNYEHMECIAENLTYEEAIALRNIMNAGGYDDGR